MSARVDRRLGVLPVLSVMLLLAGCAKPNAASEENFARAIEPLVADRFCRDLSAQLMTTAAYSPGETPPPLPLMVPTAPPATAGDAQGRNVLEDATRDGLLTRTTTTAPARRWLGGEPLAPMPLVVYTPTDAGKAVFRPVQREAADHHMHAYPELCIGRGRVDKVIRWTEPADLFGQTMTRVTYSYSAADLPPSVPKDLRATLTRPQEATTTLVKTSDGWQPAR